MKLKQFDFNLERFEFTIESEGLRTKRNRLSNSTETFSKFEDIGTKISKEKHRKIIWLLIGLFFVVVAVGVFINRMSGAKIGDSAEIVWLCIAAVFFGLYIFTKTNYIYLTRDDYSYGIEFINRKVYAEQLDDFFKTLIERRKEYLLEKYLVVDEFSSYEVQKERLVWLKDEKLISADQLREKLEELKKLNLNRKILSEDNINQVKGFRNQTDREID